MSVFSALLLRNPKRIISLFPTLSEFLNKHSLLYIPLSKGGKPQDIVQFRALRSAIVDLLRSLPVMGLLVETHELLETSLAMERNHPPGAGSITEFDGLFKVGFRGMVKSLNRSTRNLLDERCQQTNDKAEQKGHKKEVDTVLFDCIELLTESMSVSYTHLTLPTTPYV